MPYKGGLLSGRPFLFCFCEVPPRIPKVANFRWSMG
jgi:hypothetical protein